MSAVLFIPPVEKRFAVPAPKLGSEFDVQAHLWSLLRASGFDVRGEVKARAQFDGAKKHHVTCRFDLVVYQDNEAVLIVEVKARPVRHKDGFEATRQGSRYPFFGVPVVVAYGMASADAVVDYATTLCGKKRRPSKQEA